MKKCTFQRCLRAVPTMTSAQRHDLRIAINHRDKKDLVAEVASLVGTPTACPHCHHPEIRPWGRAAGLPRFRCRGCHRTFNALTNTPLSGLHHKDRWLFFLEKFSEGESVRKAAGWCGINTKAAFLGIRVGFLLNTARGLWILSVLEPVPRELLVFEQYRRPFPYVP